jgi:predicted dehydrogenase
VLFTYPDAPPPAPRTVSVAPRAPRAGLNLGVIGAGAHFRDRLLPALQAIPEVALGAICTASGAGAKALAARLQVPYCTTDYREILKDGAIDTVLIATPHRLHAVTVLEALQAGKHVFVEKPLCLTEEELDAILAAYAEAAARGLILTVGLNRRFSSHLERARDLFAARQNPLVMSYRVNGGAIPAAHWIQDPEVGGGRILGEAVHFIDAMQALCGSPATSVQARRVGYHASGIADDHAVVSLGFGDGSIGTLVYAAGGDTGLPKERLEAFGDGRAVVLDDFACTELYAGGKRRRYKTGARDKGFVQELTAFVRAVRGAGPIPIPIEAIAAATRAVLLAARSQRSGRLYDV